MVCSDTKAVPLSLANVSHSRCLDAAELMLIVPDTLEAYINKYSSLVPYLADDVNGTPETDDAPSDLTKSAISLQVRRLSGFRAWAPGHLLTGCLSRPAWYTTRPA